MKIYFFSDFSGDCIGGMKVHQTAFLKNYLDAVLIVKQEYITVYRYGHIDKCFKDISSLINYIGLDVADHERVFFFNNLSWLMDIPTLRSRFCNDIFVMRSGGNDIFKALDKTSVSTFKDRLRLTADTINLYMDRLIVNSDYSYFRNIEIGILPRKMIKIRGGADRSCSENNMKLRMKNRRAFDEKYKTYGKKILVIAARFVPFKGIPEFVSSFASSPVNQQYHLLLIGGGRQQDIIIHCLEQELTKKNWTYVGEMSSEETFKMISIADLFVNPSIEYVECCLEGSFVHTETMGRGMIEAISQCIPVLALNSGGTAELFCENSCIGYLADKHCDMIHFLKKFIDEEYEFISETDYFWDSVFHRYNMMFYTLMHKERTAYALALDYDGTIKTKTNTEEELSQIMRENSSHTYICLTAESADEAIPLLEKLPLDYIVYENGAGIASADGRPIYWNELADAEKKKGYTELIITKISSIAECKQTHPFVIHIGKENISAKAKEMLECIIEKLPYQLIESNKYIKIQHTVFNKKCALDYILKDICCDVIVGAGNGLNDVSFIQSCDIMFMSEDLIESIHCADTDIVTFKKSEAGAGLLRKVFESLKES